MRAGFGRSGGKERRRVRVRRARRCVFVLVHSRCKLAPDVSPSFWRAAVVVEHASLCAIAFACCSGRTRGVLSPRGSPDLAALLVLLMTFTFRQQHLDVGRQSASKRHCTAPRKLLTTYAVKQLPLHLTASSRDGVCSQGRFIISSCVGHCTRRKFSARNHCNRRGVYA